MAKLTLTALKQVLAANDNRLYVSVATADNVYVTGGVALSLAPGTIKDPNAVGVTGPSQQPVINPGPFSVSWDGYYPEVIPSTTGLAGYKLRIWESEGTELAAGAYPAAISAGTLVLEIPYES